MAFNTNILKSHTARQAFGAIAGMLVAALLYVAFDQASYNSITGLLIQPGTTISEHANQIRVNDKNIDDENLRRIASRARTVAAALETAGQESSEGTVAQTPVNERAAGRRAARVFANQLGADLAAAPVVAMPLIQEEVSDRERLAIRNDRIVAARAEDATHPGAPASSQLPSSGLGLNLMVIVAALGAFALAKTDIRNKLIGAMASIV